MLSASCAFLFSRLNTSSACAARMSRSRFTSSASTSWSTSAFSRDSTAPLTCMCKIFVPRITALTLRPHMATAQQQEKQDIGGAHRLIPFSMAGLCCLILR